jgi:hypothetical protein
MPTFQPYARCIITDVHPAFAPDTSLRESGSFPRTIVVTFAANERS